MARYKETTRQEVKNISEYVRSSEIHLSNPLGKDPKITFSEEAVTEVNSQPVNRSYLGSLEKELTTANQNTPFDVLNPINDQVTGKSNYKEVYNLLYSLYFHLAAERDAG